MFTNFILIYYTRVFKISQTGTKSGKVCRRPNSCHITYESEKTGPPMHALELCLHLGVTFMPVKSADMTGHCSMPTQRLGIQSRAAAKIVITLRLLALRVAFIPA